MTFPFSLIAGLDPAIQPAPRRTLHVPMDARVKPGHEGVSFVSFSPTRREGNRRTAP